MSENTRISCLTCQRKPWNPRQLLELVVVVVVWVYVDFHASGTHSVAGVWSNFIPVQHRSDTDERSPLRRRFQPDFIYQRIRSGHALQMTQVEVFKKKRKTYTHCCLLNRNWILARANPVTVRHIAARSAAHQTLARPIQHVQSVF